MTTNEPTILCPSCKSEIRLTESLAAPLVEATKREYERRLELNNQECTRREEAVRQQELALSKTQQKWQADQDSRMRQERDRIAKEESRRAAMQFSADLDQRSSEIQHLQQVLKIRDEKLAEARIIQAQCLEKERELNDEKRGLELTIAKRIQSSLTSVRQQALQETEEQFKLKVSEKEQTITAMQRQIEDLKRRAEQGSQQLQGEVQEMALESLLTAKFPFDSIEPVRKGENGGDFIQRVVNGQGQSCGSILWEAKRTKNWSDSWLPKLRTDQRQAKAEIAVLVSQVLPKNTEAFDLIDDVWITHPRTIIPVACVLRHSLIEIEAARRATEGQQTKAEMVYQYLAGPRFRQRVQAVVEAFTSMQEDLAKEKRAILKQWAKRDEQIERVMKATVGMYGDMQGIAGKTMQEIEGLEMDEADGRLDQATTIKRIA